MGSGLRNKSAKKVQFESTYDQNLRESINQPFSSGTHLKSILQNNQSHALRGIGSPVFIDTPICEDFQIIP